MILGGAGVTVSGQGESRGGRAMMRGRRHMSKATQLANSSGARSHVIIMAWHSQYSSSVRRREE